MLSCIFRYNYLLFCRSSGYIARGSYSYQEGAAYLIFAHFMSFQNGVGRSFVRNKMYFTRRLAICFLWLEEERVFMSLFSLKSAWNFHIVLLYNVQFCYLKLNIPFLVYEDEPQTTKSLMVCTPCKWDAKVWIFQSLFPLLHGLWKNLSCYA